MIPEMKTTRMRTDSPVQLSIPERAGSFKGRGEWRPVGAVAFGGFGQFLEVKDHPADYLPRRGDWFHDGIGSVFAGQPRRPALTPGTDKRGGLNVPDRHRIVTARADDRPDVDRDQR